MEQLSQCKQSSFLLTRYHLSIVNEMSSGWKGLCLRHWQIIHDLNSNSPRKRECSVLGLKYQLFRTQTFWKKKERKKYKMSFGYPPLYPEPLLLWEAHTHSLLFAAHEYVLVLLLQGSCRQSPGSSNPSRVLDFVHNVRKYHPMKLNLTGKKINGWNAGQLATCTSSFPHLLGLTWRWGEGERVRFLTECRAWRGAQSHDLEISTWAETKSQTFNWLCHPSAPGVQNFEIMMDKRFLGKGRESFWA